MKYFLIFLSIPWWCCVYGQNTQGEIQKESFDLDSCISLSNYYLNKNLDSSLYFAEKAKDQLDENNSNDAVRVYLCFSEAYSAQGDMDRSLENSLHAKRINDDALESDPDNVNFIIQNADILCEPGF